MLVGESKATQVGEHASVIVEILRNERRIQLKSRPRVKVIRIDASSRLSDRNIRATRDIPRSARSAYTGALLSRSCSKKSL